ncbi:MAG: N-acetylmuramoyl-L-alanine amidase [Veillonellales bacterium]
MYRNQLVAKFLLMVLLLIVIAPVPVTHAAGIDNVIGNLASSTIASPSDGNSSSGLLNSLFSLIFDKLLGPILNLLGGGSHSSSSSATSPVKVTPLPSPAGSSSTVQDNGVLRGKVIVVDPGHGGSNPGAVANNTRESDNNLAVGLKLQGLLTQAGAKVIMTRDMDRTVAREGSTLGQELQARVDLAETNHADIFVSIHSNENPDSNVAGAMTFYSSGKSPDLATEVQSALIKETGAVDKGTSTATYYVLRNTTMPGILVEMGFVSNQAEAARLQNDAYRGSIARGIFNGIVKYFNRS